MHNMCSSILETDGRYRLAEMHSSTTPTIVSTSSDRITKFAFRDYHMSALLSVGDGRPHILS